MVCFITIIVSLEIQFLATLKTNEIGDELDIRGKYPLGVNVKQENLPRKSSSLSRKAFVYWGLCKIRSAVNFIFLRGIPRMDTKKLLNSFFVLSQEEKYLIVKRKTLSLRVKSVS